MKLVSSILGGIGLGVAVTMFTLGGCGGDKSAPPSTSGGSASVGGQTSNGGVANNGGGTSAGGKGTTGGTSSAGTGKCPTGPTVVSADNGKMTDFTAANITGAAADGTFGVNINDATASDVNIQWGTTGLTGGTFFYVPNDSAGVRKAADGIQAAIVNDTLSLKANIAANDYSGFGFYFGPNCGSNACAFAGISFTLSGTLGNATVDVQMQQNDDYPLNQANKGLCDYITADAGAMWSYCKNPHTSLSTLMTTPISTTAQAVQMPWTAFTGGNPVAALDCHQLLGLQFQFNCGTTACTPNVTIDDLKFY